MGDAKVLRIHWVSELHAQRELYLSRRKGITRPHEVGWDLVVSREIVDSSILTAEIEAR
jgi:hypothetical protein